EPMMIVRDRRVLAANPPARTLLGDHIEGTDVRLALRHPAAAERLAGDAADEGADEAGAPTRAELVGLGGAERPWTMHVNRLPDGSRLVRLADLSQARAAERMRVDFVANASHELRTPLASLRGFIETIQGPAKNDLKAQARFLNIMLDQTTRMSRLVDDLLSLSRLELKSHIAPDEKVDLVPLLGHVRDALVPLAKDVGVVINLHLPDGKVEVLGDRDELVQVFENLMENACKYGQEGEVVDVWLKNGTGQPVEVSIVDKGPGIPAEHVPRLTERFYRVSIEDSRSKKGTGLGLAIVKHILTRHRARLIVKSEVGKGTNFTVRF
ncbi:ATP-binding protein, partial [Rhizobium sp.]|uniref:ATP-binding protein n=1 Tax=Rhizobium sp. TaxID=391 RepID=UPI00389B0F4B